MFSAISDMSHLKLARCAVAGLLLLPLPALAQGREMSGYVVARNGTPIEGIRGHLWKVCQRMGSFENRRIFQFARCRSLCEFSPRGLQAIARPFFRFSRASPRAV